MKKTHILLYILGGAILLYIVYHFAYLGGRNYEAATMNNGMGSPTPASTATTGTTPVPTTTTSTTPSAFDAWFNSTLLADQNFKIG